MSRNQLRPAAAHATAVGIVAEWGARAEAAHGDCSVMDSGTAVAVSSGRLAAVTARMLAAHAPVWMDGGSVCPSCVEIHGGAGIVRASYPCQQARMIFDEVLGPDDEAAGPEFGLQMTVQDGPEPYMSAAAAALERMHGASPAAARSHASTVLGALGRFNRRR